MIDYNEIKTGKIIVYEDEPCEVMNYHVARTQQRKPQNQVKLRSLISGKTFATTFHVSDKAEEADIIKRDVKFLYQSKGEYWFHEHGNPANRFTLAASIIGDQAKFIKPKSDIDAVLYNEQVIGVNIPIKIELKVTEAMEAVKGNTSSGATKAVVLETGATVYVPMFINEGDIVSINTETGQYTERVSKS